MPKHNFHTGGEVRLFRNPCLFTDARTLILRGFVSNHQETNLFQKISIL